jgi:predicted nuclease of predicted toxin-antitoxin system
MRLCANENIPGDGVAALRGQGHDVLWIREAMPGATDEQVLAQATLEQRLLITFDKDFGEMAFRRGKKATAGVVLFRISQPSAKIVAETIVRVLTSRNDWAGNFSVVDDHTVRMRPLR